MKRLLIVGLFFVAGANISLADSVDSVMTQNDEFTVAGYRLQPCRFWSRDNTSRAYVCDSLDMRIDVTTVREVQNVIDQLVSRIQQLEARVLKLENPKE